MSGACCSTLYPEPPEIPLLIAALELLIWWDRLPLIKLRLLVLLGILGLRARWILGWVSGSNGSRSRCWQHSCSDGSHAGGIVVRQTAHLIVGSRCNCWNVRRGQNFGGINILAGIKELFFLIREQDRIF